MANEKFLLVSLQEEKAKELAQVITNDSCRKILEYLADKDATESELAEALEIPISTVHYNLKQLTKSGLVSADEFHYSEKGKEVNHYKLANKYIVIGTKSAWGIKEKLKSVLPAVAAVSIAAGIMQLWQRYNLPITQDTAFARDAAPKLLEAAPIVAQALEAPKSEPSIALWFLLGGLLAISAYLIADYLLSKRSKK